MTYGTAPRATATTAADPRRDIELGGVADYDGVRAPADEAARLEALAALGILDTLPDARFDRIVRLAAAHFDAPIIRLSFVDRERVWAKASIGLDVKQAPREVSICSRVIAQSTPLAAPDLVADDRFKDYPQVAGGPRFRAYFGAPIIIAGGWRIGAICVIDRRPRPDVGPQDIRFLEDLAALVVDALHQRRQVAERQRRLEAARRDLARAENAKRRFLAIISHELRTPLNALAGFSEVLSEELLGPHSAPEYREYAGHMRAAAGRLGALVERVLTYTAAETHELALIESDVALAPLLRKCVALVRAAKTVDGRPKIALEIAADAPKFLRADEAHLTQIVMELLENAIAHSNASCRIFVQAACAEDGGVRLAVSDCGPGMPAREIARLTEAFTQADERLARTREGAGLGLAIVRTLADLHDGRIAIHNRRAGGTVVEVTLPASRSLPDAVAA